MSSILVEEVGIDIVLPLPADVQQINGADTSIADASSEGSPAGDVEMQQRMDEDDSTTSPPAGDCEMAESAIIVGPVVETILDEQVQEAVHRQHSTAEERLAPLLPSVEPQPCSPSLSDYIESPAMLADAPTVATDSDATAHRTYEASAASVTAARHDPADHFADHHRLIELARQSWGVRQPNYLRGCLWSPDGTCLLAPVNRDGMHVVELPTDLYTAERIDAGRRPLDVLTSAVHVPENGTVYDYCWYPYMNSGQPETCCWLSTQQHGPIQMWDAFDGKLRCSYRGYDAVDEVEAAISVCFSSDAASVIGGYRKSVKIFRTDLPGRDCVQFALRTPASCLAVHATQPDLLAVGAWTGAVTVHDTRSPRLAVLERLQRRRAGGVTAMRFTPDGRRLWVGARKDGVLACWDVRMPVEPVLLCRREVSTNQRVQFDVSGGGRWLVSGDTGGVVRVWDLERTVAEAEDADGLREYRFAVHHDCCNGVAVHPTRPVLATCSGQHHFGTDVQEDEGVGAQTKENSLIMWWYGPGDEVNADEQ